MAITRVSGLNVIKDYTPTLRPGLDGYYYVLQRLDNGTLAAASNSFSATNTETLQLTVLNSIGTTHTALQTVATENAQHTLLNFDLAPGAYGSFFVDWSSDIVSGTNPLNSDSFGQAYTKDGIASQPAVNLSNAPGGGEFFASAVQLGNGRYLAVWNDTLASTQSSLDVSIVGRIYSSTGAAIGSEFVLANGSGIQFMAESLSLGDGRTLVFWGNAKIDSTGHADFTGMDGRFLDANGTPVGSVMSIDSMVSGKFYGSKDAVALGNGGFVVAWHESARLDGSADQVHFQRFNAAGVKVGGDVVVESVDGVHPKIESFNIFELANGGFGIESQLTDGAAHSGTVRQYTMNGVEIGSKTVLQSVAGSGLSYFMDMELMANGHIMAYGLAGSTGNFKLGTQEFDFGDERMFGTGLADTLFGHQGVNDVITAGAGNDTINGLSGNDTLTGGAGADTFVFNSILSATNRDTITDYSTAADTIKLENSVYTGLGTMTGVLKAVLYYEGTAAHLATDRIIYNPATGTLTYDRDGNGAAAAVLIATLNDTPGHHPTALAMSNVEFMVI